MATRNLLPADPGTIAAAMVTAAGLCSARGAQFTKLRRRLLEILWAAPHPLSAYELLPRVSESLERTLTPATIYRTLDFLMKQGLVARIASRNAFIRTTRTRACFSFATAAAARSKSKIPLSNAF